MSEQNKGGRPEFEATEIQREQVERYVAFGMTQIEIAKAIGCSVPTLIKHFADNIENGLARKLAQSVDDAFNSTKDGMVKYRIERMLATANAVATSQEEKEESIRPLKLGKKEQAKVDAKHAGVGTEWEDDLGSLRAN